MKPNANNAKHAILFIWTALVFKLALFVSDLMQHGFRQTSTFFIFKTVDVKVRASTETITDILLLISGAIAFIVSVVFFLRWFKTAYHNLSQIKRHLEYSEGWTIWAWFIPIINLFAPYQIMKDVYMQTREFLMTKDSESGKMLTLDHLGWWWALWIISGIRISFSPPSIIGLIAAIVGNIVFVLLALLTIKVIKDYARVEPLLQQTASLLPLDHPSPIPTPA